MTPTLPSDTWCHKPPRHSPSAGLFRLLPSPGTASQAREPDRNASASCLAAAQPAIPLRAFDRFDEILYLVDKASDLTLPDLERSLLGSVATSMWQFARESRFIDHISPDCDAQRRRTPEGAALSNAKGEARSDEEHLL
jgi:hypothetical protein